MELDFEGVGPLYQGFFGTESALEDLQVALAGCVAGSAHVRVTYDTPKSLGRILLVATPEDLTCRATASGDGFEVTELTPITAALARYRDTIASAFDIRVASFRVGLRLLGGGLHLCDLVAGGQQPPDGSTFSPCYALAGNDTCDGRLRDGVLRLVPTSAADRRDLEACFGL